MTPSDIVFIGDRMIAPSRILLFLASVGVLFFIARRLFDQRLPCSPAGWFWSATPSGNTSLSGLPQMLLLFLFNLTIYVLVRAIEAQANGRRVGIWLVAAGVGFGLLALFHALTIWIFLAALIFLRVYFRPRVWASILVLAPFVILYTPWLIRNYLVCGNPGGVAIYSFFDQIVMSEAGHMRHVAIDFAGMSAGF